MKKKRLLLAAYILLAGLAVGSISTRALMATRHQPAAGVQTPGAFAQSAPIVGRANNGILSQMALPSRLHTALRALGDRFERAGKERLVMTGLLTDGDNAQGRPFSLIVEQPGRARFTEQGGRTLVFDIENPQTNDNSQDQRDREILETLVYDSVDHFLIGQLGGAMSLRFLGGQFQAADGAAYDLFEASEAVAFRQTSRQQKKLYYFNSATHLLEQVAHQDEDGAGRVEVRLGDWREIGGQQVAHQIERLENGVVTLRFTLYTAAIAPRANDGAFTPR